MSADYSPPTVADRARRAAENIGRVADAATGPQPAARQLKAPLQFMDMIETDMRYVIEWAERRRGPETGALLWARTAEILHAIPKPPLRKPSGNLILDLNSKARTFAYSLRQWADDIEAEESQAGAAGKRKRKEPETPFTRLKALADDRQLSKNETRIIEMICDGSGKVALKDLGLRLQWVTPSDNWNSARQRLNRRLKKHGWVLVTEHGYAVAKEMPKAGRK
jgi:hypothetical protein